MATTNPYAAPAAIVDDVRDRDDADGNFVEEGVVVPAGNGFGWLKLAWALFRMQPLTWIAVMVVFMIISVVMQIVPIIGPIAAAILTPVFLGGLMLGCLALDEGDRLGVGHLFAGFRERLGPLALLGVIQLAVFFVLGIMAALLVPVLGRGAGMLVVVPIILVVVFAMFSAMWFAPSLVVMNELPALRALGASFRVSLKNWRAMLVYGLVLFLFAFGVMVVFGAVFGSAMIGAGRGNGMAALGAAAIGGFLLMLAVAALLGPIVTASIYTGYRDVFHES
jgi:hypothetical protein